MTTGEQISDWLLREGSQFAGMPTIVEALVERLRTAGIPLDRFTCGEPTLHPQARVFSYRWQVGDSFVQEQSLQHGVENTDGYRNSPFRLILETDAPLTRHRLRPGEDPPFPILQELRDMGYRDYAALPMTYTSGRRVPVAVATRHPDGFDEVHLETIAAILPALRLFSEIHAMRRMTRSLLDTYLGHDAGQQVLDGHVQRGDVQTINAVIWYCDLRGFTGLSDRLPAHFVVHVLNDYFAAMAEPLQSLGGEILKFIGDGMLAVFRIGERDRPEEICDAAMTAAELAIQAMRRLNRRRAGEGKPELRFGLALHVGDVLYGNIGTANRLDFTVIGPAVNLAARLEKIAAERKLPLVTSAAFAELCPGQLVSLGRHPLKGIDGEQEVFAPSGP